MELLNDADSHEGKQGNEKLKEREIVLSNSQSSSEILVFTRANRRQRFESFSAEEVLASGSRDPEDGPSNWPRVIIDVRSGAGEQKTRTMKKLTISFLSPSSIKASS